MTPPSHPIPDAARTDGFSAFLFDETLALYRKDSVSGVIGLELIPVACNQELQTAREFLTEHAIRVLPAFIGKIRANEIDSLVQLKIMGDVYPGGFAGGRTMRGSESTVGLRFEQQSIHENEVRTVLFNAKHGLRCTHRLIAAEAGAFRMVTLVENHGSAPVTLELLSSFSLGGLTPFCAEDASGRMLLHRFRSSWSSEGRLDTQTFEQLQLERSWIGHGVGCERFGQVGSMPVRGWFPFAAVEDREAGVVWAAKLFAPGSWQIELYRRHDRAALSGGLADREFGQWMKTLHPGEAFEAPPALVTVVKGDLDDACDRLNRAQPLNLPPEEHELPAVFNEWCHSWGNPTHESMVAVADRLQSIGISYLVIDDGWAERKGDMFQQNGDWRVNQTSFPGGLHKTVAALAARGFVTGIWFEFEVLNDGSDAWNLYTDHLLHRDGKPLEVGPRRFWDFRDPWVHEYLFEKVIHLLKENDFGYLKVDYNDTIGIGCDGGASLGDGLQEHLQGVQRFFQRIREEMPHLVIENCSSGGHRLEPSFFALTSMSSFSDAHETPEIPVIAANLLRLIPARQLQVWAVLRPEDSPARTIYSLTAAMIGRVCISGAANQLSDAQLRLLRVALALYHKVSSLLIDGTSRRFGPVQSSHRYPKGWQAVRRVSKDGSRIFVVAHTFAQSKEHSVAIPLPAGPWKIVDSFAEPSESFRIEENQLLLDFSEDFRGCALQLQKA